ncbi:polysaccharide biosynthesis tyrosine autokinase [Pseudoalteromonas sp. OOF1S-7]|uniref:polysaccharide biosynthesis tyrosine autokinase n=1 Tax=Pseudoalteromonas sp. OOF1S-7 TaxID=2917757 RepID=UPI001EF3DEF3|nr:polysaccharide biosynthesis tyrosine autokinase [Pseudoalteromonas sp. OOF1S-7]MCG7536354.1 polysaccharide biosynthesis tyrosine autokinase [Pseudoalteromonas sp. OOF1S-7]
MNAQPNLITQQKSESDNIQEFDLMALFGALLDAKWFIVGITTLFMLLGVGYAVFSTPIYQATAMVQVEEKGSSVPGFDDVSGMFESTSAAVTEIELLKSRSVIGEAVDQLKLDMVVQPKLFPVIGGRSFRKFVATEENEIAEPSFGAESFAWGGERIDVHRFNVPNRALGMEYVIRVTAGNGFTLLDADGQEVLSGKVGEEVKQGTFEIAIRTLVAREGTEFSIVKRNRLQTILDLQSWISASEKGKDSGIINLSFQHEDPMYAEMVLDKVAAIYVRRNVERNSAEAQKSLEFLEIQLPEVKRSLERAEKAFNNYQIRQESIDISLETQGVLEQIVALETKLQELELRRLELGRKFKREHPSYRGVVEQIDTVKRQRNELTGEVQDLPETQRELLRLKRDVEVNNEIYTLLLAKTQELDIVRAGTVGNVRIVDYAQANTTRPVKPKKALIVVMATLLGGLCAVAIVLIRKALHKGIEDPAEIEALGLPVYASIPFSEYQVKLTGFAKARKGKVAKAKSILAIDNPADLSVEALRSLRTSLHFAMLEAKNNVIAISGPSPGVGKSFVTVNLATILAQSGKSVLVIDGDMRKGYLQTQFGMKWDNGLSDYLSGRLTLEQVVKKTQVEGLEVITRGQIPPNPSELLMHENFTKLIGEVSAAYDLVIVDTPPILAVTDPAIVSAHAGTTLLVSRFGQNHAKELEITRNRFEQNGIDVKGVVFNGVVRKSANAYGYYGYYNYEYKSEK